MIIDNKPWQDDCTIMQFTSGRLNAMPYNCAEFWIDYKPGMSEAAIKANQAIRKMMGNAL